VEAEFCGHVTWRGISQPVRPPVRKRVLRSPADKIKYEYRWNYCRSWDSDSGVTPYSPLKVHRLEGTYCLHHQGRDMLNNWRADMFTHVNGRIILKWVEVRCGGGLDSTGA
jgi:hypothetical protein